MAWISTSFNSKALKMPVEAEILVPQPGFRQMSQTGNYKVMILLHGLNADRTEWLLKSQIAELVKELPIIVFMPSGKRSFFVNTANGYQYMDYIIKEVPEFLKKHFSVSVDKRDWLVAGESMGGYGAAACGLHGCEQFGNVGIFSGALDIVGEEMQTSKVNMELIFGKEREEVADSSYNLYRYCHQIPEQERPRIFLCCGKQDMLLDMNRRFYTEIKEEYDVTYSEGEGGHDFIYWNECLKAMLPWFVADKTVKEVLV